MFGRYIFSTECVHYYYFCELETLVMRNIDDMRVRDVVIRNPEGPMAKQLLKRFNQIARSKIGKRQVGEFRDSNSETYILHILVSSDGGELCLRAKNVYDAAYIPITVFEGDQTSPWNKRCMMRSAPPFSTVASEVDNHSASKIDAISFGRLIMVRP